MAVETEGWELAGSEHARSRRGASLPLFLLLPLLILPLVLCGAAWAGISDEPRTALLIGNSAYASSPLLNPRNDAEDLARLLGTLGFDVELLVDQGQREMKLAIRSFRERLKQRGGVGLFYYAGHGMEVGGENYLIPVGADIPSETYVDVEAVPMREVTAGLADARNRMNIVILDACRNNPFARSWRSGSRGLAVMRAPAETLIAYATEPGSTAADGAGTRNSPYAHALMESLQEPGVRLVDVFRRTRAMVKSQTGGGQVPWQSDNLTTDAFYFIPPPATRPRTAGPIASVAPVPGPVPKSDSTAKSSPPQAAPGETAQKPVGILTELASFEAGSIAALALSPDGGRIVTGHWGNQVEMRGTKTGEVVWSVVLAGDGDLVLSVAFSPDGKRVIAGSRDTREIKILDARTGAEISVLLQNRNKFFGKSLFCDGVAFSPDGSKVVTACHDWMDLDPRVLKVWDARTTQELFELEGTDSPVVFSPDSQWVVSGSPSLKVLNARTGEIRWEADNGTSAIAFSPDGKQIVHSAAEGVVKIRDSKTGEEIRRLTGNTESVHSVAFSPNGARIAAGTGASGTGFGSVRIWDARSGKVLAKVEGDALCPEVRCGVGDVAFTADGRQLIGDVAGRAIKIWSAEAGP